MWYWFPTALYLASLLLLSQEIRSFLVPIASVSEKTEIRKSLQKEKTGVWRLLTVDTASLDFLAEKGEAHVGG